MALNYQFLFNANSLKSPLNVTLNGYDCTYKRLRFFPLECINPVFLASLSGHMHRNGVNSYPDSKYHLSGSTTLVSYRRKNSSTKWPTMCRVGRKTLLAHSFTQICAALQCVNFCAAFSTQLHKDWHLLDTVISPTNL